MKTVKQILEETKLGNVLKAKRLYWKVVQHDEEAIVACPFNIRTKKLMKNNKNYFELWNCGTESIAVIPELTILKD